MVQFWWASFHAIPVRETHFNPRDSNCRFQGLSKISLLEILPPHPIFSLVLSFL